MVFLASKKTIITDMEVNGPGMSMFSEFLQQTTVSSAFLAHLSRRLTGELIVYPCSVVRPSVVSRPSVVRRPSFTISKIFSSETAWPIKAKLHVEHP